LGSGGKKRDGKIIDGKIMGKTNFEIASLISDFSQWVDGA
jgi:hypothetical protein